MAPSAIPVLRANPRPLLPSPDACFPRAVLVPPAGSPNLLPPQIKRLRGITIATANQQPGSGGAWESAARHAQTIPAKPFGRQQVAVRQSRGISCFARELEVVAEEALLGRQRRKRSPGLSQEAPPPSFASWTRRSFSTPCRHQVRQGAREQRKVGERGPRCVAWAEGGRSPLDAPVASEPRACTGRDPPSLQVCSECGCVKLGLSWQ